ncbi:PDZ domain-containing protein [Mucilaginibacter mali]|uniref:PDZ domain-containing protein n=1 Tax=Mucilaginibacter mali TaxID=2740462 RepID=A0A7D4UJC8_9SPHI|nr:PDZ domain-containing protein [Mucilaginibacter mali]QKJ28922.1 PDZ domain-containing protein [Mucilaginibacter mali]
MLKRFCLFALLNIIVSIAYARDIYVSPIGNDHSNGSKTAPFATLQKAQAAARKNKQEKVTIWLMGGTCYINNAVVFTAADARPANAPLSIKAYQNQQVTLAASKALALNWQPYKNGIMQARVKGDVIFDELFVNGQLQHMARYPNYDADAKHFNGTADDVLSPERIARWQHSEGGYIHALHKSEWGDMAYRITGKDAKGELTMEGGWQNNRPSAMHAKYRFAENIFEELDAENEWYYDKTSHTLYYYPPKNLNLKNAIVSTPQLESLFVFNGDAAKPVTNINIDGLQLTQTLRTFMKNREPLLRSDWTIYRVGAITMQGAEHCSITNCYFNNVGGNAMVFSNYNRNNEISGCKIIGAGSSGVAFVGDPAAVRSPLFQYSQANDLAKMDKTPGPVGNNYPADCRVYNNLIEGIGRVEKQVAGVQLSMCQSITVSHNTIDDVPRAGINVNEGTWGGHIIEFNDVFNTVQETGDHGSFNSWGRDRFWFPNRKQMDSINLAHPELALLDVVKPIIIRNNRFRCDHGWDIDLDDGSSNYEICNNLCLNGGLKLREGFNRKVYNNVIINNSFHPHVWFKDSKVSFQHNIVSSGYFPIGVKFWGDDVDNNLFPDSAALNKSLKNHTDAHSTYGDPMFVDAAKGNFTVKPNSPAFKIGFKNFPMDEFGVVSPRLKAVAHKISIPAIAASMDNSASATMAFLGAKVKSLNTLGERSATGMASETGALVLDVPRRSVLYGVLNANDVILQVGERKINDIKDLAAAAMGLQIAKEITLEIFRNQAAQKVVVKLK